MLKKIIERFQIVDRDIPHATVLAALSRYPINLAALFAAPDPAFYAEIYSAVVSHIQDEHYPPRFPRPDELRNKLLTAIPATHLDALAITAAEAGISLSELIRRVIANAAKT